MKTLGFAWLVATLLPLQAAEYPPPRIVGTPPADAGRGLVRVNAKEIRHYDGDRTRPGYLVSRDNGETWSYEKAAPGYPLNYGGMSKEAPAFARNPRTGEFIRVQPIKDHVFLSRGGLDGEWVAATKDGRASDAWREQREDLLTIPGILRTPLFIDGGRRLVLPTHGNGTTMWLSDDGGLTWRRSKTTIKSPPHAVGGVHRGLRWQNIAVEATVVELRDGRLWALLRTSQDHHYESFSADRGETWSEGRPSRFAATLTMPTLGRLPDGRLLLLWTNQAALPELSTATGRGEDAFTNRDTLHAAISADDGLTWQGFREVGLDEHRARADYATWGGPQDRGNHQAEFLPLDDHRVLIAYGQHANHRRLAIMDTRWLVAKQRTGDFARGAGEWTHHTFLPVPRGHCSYHRRPAASVVAHPTRPGVQMLDIRLLDDLELTNPASSADYRSGGAAWNFPAGRSGALTLRFRLPAGSDGAHLSLMDQLFNACDRTAPDFAAYTLRLLPGAKLGTQTLKADADHELRMEWSGAEPGQTCVLTLDGRPAGSIECRRSTPNGLSYLHCIAAGGKPAPGIQLESTRVEVRR
ncbi:MAG: exo-alpha-sialidase [Verrucomicrobia bacterium]|nr:exo-alpha-sialidase [Verrucomicrobiota bacterium]